ncbi:MAG: type II toxin-antitoxin system VapC family toxin [Gammaproteobacteria bacterium]|nr:type II toxin-antitoxin system VapC family toxin [Gammaproteobacteria bacterium]
MKYVLDTNTLIYFFKGMGQVATKLLAVSPQELAIPSVVLHELEYGIAKSSLPAKRTAQLAELCTLVEILSFGNEAARLAASVRVQLERQGTPIGPYDLLIAGTTLASQGVLVTNNTKEFARVPGLSLENWYPS